jgi:hypothetical protein
MVDDGSKNVGKDIGRHAVGECIEIGVIGRHGLYIDTLIIIIYRISNFFLARSIW